MEKIINLDLRDKKIISELDWNARITNTELARKVHLSKKAVEYRIKQLETKGVISGYYPIINFNILGFTVNRVQINLQYSNDAIKKQIEEYAINDPNINWVVETSGESDFAMNILSRSLKEVKEVIYKLRLNFGEYIKKVEFSTTIGLDQYPYNFILGVSNSKEIRLKEEKQIIELDELEKKILRVLIEDARQNSSKIARKINSNYKTVKKKITLLERKKVLLGYRAVINTEKLNYRHYKILIYINQNFRNRLKEIESYIKRQPETVYMVDHLGSEDIDAELIFKSQNDFLDFIDKLHNAFPGIIKEYKSFIFLKTLKLNYLPYKI